MSIRSASRVWSLGAGFLVVLLMVSCLGGCSDKKSKNTKNKKPKTIRAWIQAANEHSVNMLTREVENDLIEALKLCKDESDASDKAAYYSQIAEIQLDYLKDKPKAKKSLQLAREAAKEIKDAEVQAKKLTAIAVVIGKIERKDAMDILKEAEGIVGKIKDTDGKILVYLKIAEAYGELKLTGSVDRVLDAAKELAKKAEKPSARCKMLGNIAETQYKIKKDVAGFDEAIDCTSEIKTDYTKARGLLNIAENMIHVGLKGKARKIIKEAANIKIEDESQKPEIEKQVGRLEAKLAKK